MNKHTISAERLLKPYNGAYKYIVMNKSGFVYIYLTEPHACRETGFWYSKKECGLGIGKIAITEFQNKPWQECIYKAKPSEEDMIGCLGWFWDNNENNPSIGILKELRKAELRYGKTGGVRYLHFRPATRDEIKFFNDDTVADQKLQDDPTPDQYLTITADDITISGKSTKTYNGTKIPCRDAVIRYFNDANEKFQKEYNAELIEMHVCQANNLSGIVPVADKDGLFAWFRCVFRIDGQVKYSRWVFLSSYASVDACRSDCALYCGILVRLNAAMRSGVFGSVGN